IDGVPMNTTFRLACRSFIRSTLSSPSQSTCSFTLSWKAFSTMAIRKAPDYVAKEAAANIHAPRDPNTLSNYNAWRTKHTTADFDVDFDAKRLTGVVHLELEKFAKESKVILDTSHLEITGVEVEGDKAQWELAKSRIEPYGSPLTINVEEKHHQSSSPTLKLRIGVNTTKDCTALQWLTPAQTSNRKHPYMFSQCQAIHARSLFPCQDTPDVKSTYTFNIRSPLPVLASGLPAGVKDFRPGENGKPGTLLYAFHQEIPMPSYLFALASGDLASASIGPRSTVWTGPEELKASQWEFEKDTEAYIQAAEKIVYPHSWSGNLVSNASWEHFWLNEGWTTYLERRLQADIHGGDQHRDFSAIIGWKALTDSIEQFGEDHEFTKLIPDLKGKDPDDAFSSVPYEKGFNFLYHLEKLVGKDKWDRFIPHYFTTFKKRSVDSYEFKATLLSFFESDKEASKKLNDLDWDTWFYKPGFPPKPNFDTTLADIPLNLAKDWQALNDGKSDFKPSKKDIADFNSNQSVVFLEAVQTWEKPLKTDLVDLMGDIYSFAGSKNVELVSRYFVAGLQAGAKSVFEPTAKLLGEVGRMKFVRPLYRELIKNDPELAKKTFEKNKEFYHPICRGMVEKLFEKHAKA
ncbi:Leucine aminopeptidase 2, partial [Pseudocercospora fuligena]